ncbi:uncharacterized protein FFB14_13447 [Fusarium fujikuroi]|nr:uncharacterized protein FFB14_13447 [Fusarium fujikuroi]
MDHDGEDMPLGMQVRTTCMRVATWLDKAYRGSPCRRVDYVHNRMRWVVRKREWEDLETVPRHIETWARVTSDPNTAAANAITNRDNMDKWVPEIHAIFTQSLPDLQLLLETWVHREGSEHVYARKTVARDAWVQATIDAGLSRFEVSTEKERKNSICPSIETMSAHREEPT